MRRSAGPAGYTRRVAQAAAASACGTVAQRRGGHRGRRHHRTALGCQDQGPRHLSRPGTFVPGPVRQNQRPALAVSGGDTAGAVRCPALGEAGQGSAGVAGGMPDEGLPFLTVLAPSARWSEAQGKRHKTLTDRARQAILQTKRWLGDRRVVIVADSSFAVLELIAAVRRHVCLITRLRLDASLCEPAPERRPGQRGRPRLKGKRLPKLSAVLADPATVWTSATMAEWYGGQRYMLEYASGIAVWYTSGLPPAKIRWILVRDPSGERDSQAFLCTEVDLEPTAILGRFVFRWRIETTFQEVREHLGVETQRQWSDRAILRTTPALLGIYSLITIWAHG
jgi:hypothetical protein